MPVIRSADVAFAPGMVPNYRRRLLVDSKKGAGAITIGEAIMEPSAELPLHTHFIEEAMVITKGTIEVILGNETSTLKAGDVILAPAGVKHIMKNRSKENAEFLFFYPAVEVQLMRV